MRTWRGLAALASVGAMLLLSASMCDPGGDDTDNAVNCKWKSDTGTQYVMPFECDPPAVSQSYAMPSGSDGVLVSFGDSFSSGEGAPQPVLNEAGGIASGMLWEKSTDYFAGTDEEYNRCHRSPVAYAPRLARELNLTLDFRACSGAVSQDYWNEKKGPDRLVSKGGTQEPAQKRSAGQATADLPANTKLVTVGFGGNNVGFADLVLDCILAGYKDKIPPLGGIIEDQQIDFKCADDVRAAQADAAANLGVGKPLDDPGSIEGVFTNLASSVPDGVPVIAVTYPRMFPEDGDTACGLGTGSGATLSAEEQQAINAFEADLNRYIAEAATTAGIRWVDMWDAFEGHGMCVDQEPDPYGDGTGRWVNRFRLGDETGVDIVAKAPESKESVHPNMFGQESYFHAVLACYRDPSDCGDKAAPMNPIGSVGEKDSEDVYRQATMDAAGCPAPDETWSAQDRDGYKKTPLGLQQRDVTGDGWAEMIVSLECFTTTASNPDTVVVFDLPADVQKEPKVIGVLGNEYYFKTGELLIDGTALTMQGGTIGEGDARCCAGHWARVVYRWDGAQFAVVEKEEALTKQPIQHVGLDTGDYVGALQLARSDDVFVDLYADYAEYPDSEAACAAHGIDPEQEQGQWCGNFFWTNDNDLVRAVRVADDAKITYFDNDMNDHVVTKAQLQDLNGAIGVAGFSADNGLQAFKIEAVNGEITEMTQVFVS